MVLINLLFLTTSMSLSNSNKKGYITKKKKKRKKCLFLTHLSSCICLFLLVQSRFFSLSIKLIKIRTRNTPHQPCLMHLTILILKLPMFFHDPPGKVLFTSNLFPNNKISHAKENFQHLQTYFQILTSAIQESAHDAPAILLIFSTHLSLNTFNKVICIKLPIAKRYSL